MSFKKLSKCQNYQVQFGVSGSSGSGFINSLFGFKHFPGIELQYGWQIGSTFPQTTRHDQAQYSGYDGPPPSNTLMIAKFLINIFEKFLIW